jgi:hypothetical protein
LGLNRTIEDASLAFVERPWSSLHSTRDGTIIVSLLYAGGKSWPGGAVFESGIKKIRQRMRFWTSGRIPPTTT